MLLVTIVAMAVAIWQQHLKYAPLVEELRTLRDELGHLTIDDPAKPHAIEVETNEENHWRWRVYIPDGSNYGVSCYSNYIPQFGIPEKKGSGGWSTLPPGEHRFDLWVEPDQSNRDLLKVRFNRFGAGGVKMNISKRKLDWIYNEETQGSTYSWSTVGKQTKSFRLDEPIVLFRLRPYVPKVSGRDANGRPTGWTHETITEPCDGLMIWIDQRGP